MSISPLIGLHSKFTVTARVCAAQARTVRNLYYQLESDLGSVLQPLDIQWQIHPHVCRSGLDGKRWAQDPFQPAIYSVRCRP